MAAMTMAKGLGFGIAAAGLYTIANTNLLHSTTNSLFESLNNPKKINFIAKKSPQIHAMLEINEVSAALKDVNDRALELRDLQGSGTPVDEEAFMERSVTFAAEILDEHVRGKFVFFLRFTSLCSSFLRSSSFLFAGDLGEADHKSLSKALQEFEELKKVVKEQGGKIEKNEKGVKVNKAEIEQNRNEIEAVNTDSQETKKSMAMQKELNDRRYDSLVKTQQQQQQLLQQQTHLSADEFAQRRLALEMQNLKDSVAGEISTLKVHKIESVVEVVDAEKVKAASVAEFETAELAYRSAQIAKLNVHEAQNKRINRAREAYAAQVESTQRSILAAKQTVLEINQQWNKQEGKDLAAGLHFGIPASWNIDE